MSNLLHKVKDAVTGHKDHDTTTGTTTHTHNTTSSSNPNYGSTNAGPHNSNIANKLDPKVDSDRDGSRTAGTYGSNTDTYGSSTGTGMTGTGMGTHNTNTGGHGPHNSGIANRIDPRVDSTTGATNTGYSGTTGSTGHTGHTGHTATAGGYNSSTNYGPHDSNIANKVDPRVDSDRDGSRTAGNYGTGTTTGTGAYGSHGTSTGAMGGTHSHNTRTTAGPHSSDMANKLDPRVDSDLDGSRTVGGGPNYGNH